MDAPPRRRRHLLRVQEELLLARCRRRRAPGRGAARDPVLRHEPRARVRRRRAPALPRRVHRWADAEPVRRLQHVREVRGAARAGAPPVRLRRGGDRPLRPPRGGTRRPRGPAPGARRGQGPDLLPVRAAPGPARARPVPARRADEARGPRGCPRAGPRNGRQAREPGDLLRARRRLPRRAPRARRMDAAARTAARRRRAAGRRAPRRGRVHGRPAAGPRRGARRAALRVADRSGHEHDPARAARGPRDDRVPPGAGHLRRRQRAGGRCEPRLPRRRPDPSPRRPDGGHRPTADTRRAPARRPLDRGDRSPRVGGGAGSGRRAVRRGCRPRWRADQLATDRA